MYQTDKPIASVSEDVLSRSQYAERLAKQICELKSNENITIGLYAKWGNGKTSLINMITEYLEQIDNEEGKKQYIIIRFEPWHFTNSTQLINQFLLNMANKFKSTKEKILEQLGKQVAMYASAFNIASYFFDGIPFVDQLAKLTSKALKAASSKLQNNLELKDILLRKEHVVELFSKLKQKVLIIIDDIDRLSSDQIRCVFQLVAAVGNFPNTMYLLSFDKEIVSRALGKIQDCDGDEYLEKIIQIPIQMKPIKNYELSLIIDKQFNELLSQFSTVKYTPKRMSELFTDIINPYISDIRKLKRLINTLQYKLSNINEDIEFSDLVAITCIELSKPDLYKWIYANKVFLLNEKELFEDDNKFKQKVEDSLKTMFSSNNDWGKIKIYIRRLFPTFQTGAYDPKPDMQTAMLNNYIYSPEKFERYFSLEIDNKELCTTQIENIIYKDTKSKIENYLIELNKKDLFSQFIQEVKARLDIIPENRLISLINVFVRVSEKLQESTFRLFELFDKSSSTHLAYNMMLKIAPSNRKSSFLDMLKDCNLVELEGIAQFINIYELAYGRLAANGTERTEYDKSITLEELKEVEQTFTKRCRTLLTSECLFDNTAWRITLLIMRAYDTQFINEYLANAFKSDRNVVNSLKSCVYRWYGAGIGYQVEIDKCLVDKNRMLSAINNLVKSGDFSALNEEIKLMSASFYLFTQNDNDYRDITQQLAQQQIESWKTDSKKYPTKSTTTQN